MLAGVKSITAYLLCLVCSSLADDIHVGVVVSSQQQSSIEQLLLQLSPWMPAGVRLSMYPAHGENSCQRQANALHQAGVRHFIDMCCGGFNPASHTHLIRADYLCPAQSTPAVQQQKYAAVLHYLKAQLVNKVVLIGQLPEELSELTDQNQFRHLRVTRVATMNEAAAVVNRPTNGRTAVFLENSDQLLQMISAIRTPEQMVWFVDDLDEDEWNRQHISIQPNITVITGDVECPDHLNRHIARNQPGFMAEKFVEHIQTMLSGQQDDMPTQCSVRLMRWLPRDSVNQPNVHSLRSSDWIIEGSLEGSHNASLQPQPFYAVTRSRLETMLGECKQWSLTIAVPSDEESKRVSYDQDSMPETLSLHGPGVWHFVAECSEGDYIKYACVFRGKKQCEIVRSSSREGDLTPVHHLNGTRRHRRDTRYEDNPEYQQQTQVSDYGAEWSSQPQQDYRHELIHYRQPAWPPRRRYGSFGGNKDQELISAITPSTFACGGVITGCAICFVLLSSVASIVSPLGCIGPCSIAGTSTCAKLVGDIYKETVLDARRRRKSRHLKRRRRY